MGVNRSVLRTKKAIRQAFIDLLSEKGSVEKITIIELTDKANIVRSTFYSHYTDIYSVAREIQNEIVDELTMVIKDYSETTMQDLSVPMTRLIDFFKEGENEYRKLLTSGYNEQNFMVQIKDTIASQLFEKIPLKQLDVFNNDLRLEARFYTEMLVDMVCGYLRGNVHLSLYEIRDFILRIIKRLDN